MDTMSGMTSDEEAIAVGRTLAARAHEVGFVREPWRAALQWVSGVRPAPTSFSVHDLDEYGYHGACPHHRCPDIGSAKGEAPGHKSDQHDESMTRLSCLHVDLPSVSQVPFTSSVFALGWALTASGQALTA